MQLALRPQYAAAAVAIAGAAVVAAPAVINAVQLKHLDVRLIDVAQDVANLGQSEITAGVASYNQGDFVDGLTSIVNGENNLYIAAPQDLLLEQEETVAQPYEYVYFPPGQGFAAPTDEGQLSANLQAIQELGQSLVNQGNTDFAAGLSNLGLAETTIGNDDLTVIYSEEALYGPLFISHAPNLLDPASYGPDGALQYLGDALKEIVVNPLTSLAQAAGLQLGPVGDILESLDVANTVHEFSDNWHGAFDGNFLDLAHLGLEGSQILSTGASVVSLAAGQPELAAFFTGVSAEWAGADYLLTEASTLFGTMP